MTQYVKLLAEASCYKEQVVTTDIYHINKNYDTNLILRFVNRMYSSHIHKSCYLNFDYCIYQAEETILNVLGKFLLIHNYNHKNT